MEIAIKYHDRDLDYLIKDNSKEKCGKGISCLLLEIEKSDKKISRIDLRGETGSYTFSRQVYLLANILKWLSGAELYVSDNKASGLVLPNYTG